MTSRRARHEWSLKRKALAVTLSVALLGLGTPAVSFADSTTDQQSKAVEAQETTSAVYTQDQAPASAKPVQQVAVFDNHVATEDEGLANDVVAPASSENASGAALKSEAPAPASSEDQPSGKESASTESAGETVSEVDASVGESASNTAEVDNAGSIEHTINVGQPEISGEASVVVGLTTELTACNFDNPKEVKWDSDNTDVATVDANGVVTGVGVGKANISAYSGNQSASRQIEVKRDESGNGYYVYLYTKAEGDTTGLTLTFNADGWYTIGRVWVEGISDPATGNLDYVTTGNDNYEKTMAALADPNNVDLFGVNSINLKDISWSYPGQDTGLKTAQGASDYDTSTNRTWHLDGYVNFDKVGFGSIKFYYKDIDTDKEISQEKSVNAEVTGSKFDISNYIISIDGYTYDHADPSEVVVERGVPKNVTLYYKRGTFHYTVYYKEKVTEAELASPKTVTADYGSTVKEDALDIRGYAVVGDSSQSLKIDAQNKSIAFHYAAKQGKVGYYLADSNATWTAPADTVDAGGMKYYYNYGFSKGDTVKVTDSIPTVANKAFIGWFDKERTGQAAAIRKPGETIEFIYNDNQTYTLDALWAHLEATGCSVPYDGQEYGLKTVDIAVNKGTELDQKYQEQAKALISQGTIQYSTDDGKTWSETAPKYKDAGTYPVKVKVDVTAQGQITTLEASANIEIIKRDVTLKPVDAEKPYDGKPLTASSFVVTAGSFAEGEGVESCTYAGSQTLVGQSASSIEHAAALAGTDLENNYNVSYMLGVLKVTDRAVKYAIEMQAKSGKAPYDGNEHSVSGFESNVFEFDGVKYTVSGLTASATGTDAGAYESVAEGAAVVTDPAGNDVTAQFDVTAQPGELVIEPATAVVTVKGKSAEVPYDGKEQSVEGYEFVFADNPLYVAADVKFSGDAVAKGTDAGIYPMGLSANQFSNTNKNFTNVEFVVEDGWLEITRGDIDNNKVSWTLSNLQTKYDGKTYVAGTATAEDEHHVALKVEYSVDGKNWTANPSDITATDWSDSKLVYLRATGSNYREGQYAFSKEPEQLFIGQRLLTLTSADAEKPYDGLPLVKNAQTDVSVTGDGFVGDEGAIYDITGSQTQAGSSYNEFTYRLKDNTKAENYRIEMVKGDLKVKSLETKVTVKLKGKTSILDYNGKEQSVEGYEFDSADNVLYTENDFRFDASAVAKGIDTGTHRMGLNASQFSNTNPNFANVTFVVEDGFVVITPAPLTVNAKSASRPYNGQPLTAPGTISGLVNGETAEAVTSGSQTEVGSSVNEVKGVSWGTAKEGNYYISAISVGTLEVTAQSIVPDPQNPESYLGVIVDSPSDQVYTGLEHKWAPNVTDKDGNALAAGTDYEVTYGTNDFTNVTGDIVVTIKGKGNYTGEVVRSYKITPAPLTVNAKSASRPYNGQPLTAPGTISGLVNGETAEAVTSGSQTEVGSSVNEVKGASWDTAKEGNYYIAAMNDGLLTITPKGVASMTVGKLPDVVYNGTSQAQKPVVNDGDKALVEGTDYELDFSADTTNVGTVAISITGKGNYAGSVDVNYRITPATLTVATSSASRPYNGQPLTAEGSIKGFVNGETAGFVTTGSQTAVGESDNTYAIDWAASTTAKQSNYAIVENLGKLTVTEHDGEVVATPGSYTGVYDGKPHGVDVTVTGLPEGYTVKAASSNATATDVTDEAGVTARVDNLVIVNAQGEDVTSKLKITKNTGTITVMTAILMVTTPSATVQYDGTALTAEGNIAGFVNGETAGFATTGSQTAVGESDNTYAIDWEAADATAKKSNYTIVEKLGTLKVTPNTTSIVVTPKCGTKVYDGTPLESVGVDEIVGLPKGFTLTAEVVGSVTDAGYAKASIKSFVITNVAGDDVTDQFANVTTGEATLVVTPRPVTVASADATKVYDGTELVKHEAKVSDGELVDGEEFDYEFFGAQIDAGVSDNTFEVKPGNDATKLENYEITYDRGVLVITPAPYSVTTESATKVYDGDALTAPGKIEGLVNGETANLKVTGGQTKVGASENTYTIEWTGTAKESNYKLESENIGTLTVAAVPDSPTPDDQSKDQGIFNGNDANSGLVQTGDATGIYGMAAVIAAVVAAFVSLLAVRRRKK